ncbi:ABC transporter substrate-binding protein [Alkalihalophilus lindianensis]|uniref:ABC transporter substrate-binding protein n=1 Tax=Alkalihalophilus lindianensis TaxID=1630542 RepID=A0ABU3XF92_9BACI|nr:ABC transporter substrate-binding protein [Alkalihalophilus lindianensis]MDV2686558.1 ABC transporter substrate-binding protein [Alkalihalophilus lindianensis]
MKKSVKLWALLCVFVIVTLTACGSGEETAAVVEKETSEVETEQQDDSTVDEEVAEGTFTVEHIYGETEVPVNPEKVVVLSHVSWEGSLVSVGVKPYAVMAYDSEFPPHLIEELEGVEALPYADEINPEEIVQLNPDLLIISDRYEPLYEQLSDSIPTVVVEVGGDWKDDHLKVTEAVGKLDEGQKVINKLENEAEEIGNRIRESVGEETFMAVSINKKDIRVYGRNNHATNALLFDDLKLTPAENIPEDFGENISIEGLVKYNPDHIIDVTYFNSGEYYDSITQGEVWNGLEAVKKDNVHTLTTTWGFWDPIEREKGLQEIEELLLNE